MILDCWRFKATIVCVVMKIGGNNLHCFQKSGPASQLHDSIVARASSFALAPPWPISVSVSVRVAVGSKLHRQADTLFRVVLGWFIYFLLALISTRTVLTKMQKGRLADWKQVEFTKLKQKKSSLLSAGFETHSPLKYFCALTAYALDLMSRWRYMKGNKWVRVLCHSIV